MGFWKQQRVVVTGGAGFLGGFVMEALRMRGCEDAIAPRSAHYDLRDLGAVRRLLRDAEPTLVIHLAAKCGGIGANRVRPAEFFYENLMMGAQLVHEAYAHEVKKLVVVGTVCAYPRLAPAPFREDDLWNGYPEDTNAPYAIAKKALLVQSQAYRQQYGFDSIYLLPANLYGPRDNFDLDTSHVIPALIRKCTEAKERGDGDIVVWGTGAPTREFLFVRDAAEGILLAAQSYDEPDPVNLGTGQEIAIRDLVAIIASLAGFDGRVRWDTGKPDGQPRRRLSTQRAADLFGFVAQTPLEVGLKETVEWYTAQRSSAEGEP